VQRRGVLSTARLDASDVISAVAVLIALAALISGRRDVARERRDRQAELEQARVDRRESLRLLEEERNARKEEIALLRRQVETTQHQAEQTMRASITARQGSSSRGDPYGEYVFTVTNLGPSWARQIFVWLSDDETDDPLTERVQIGGLRPHEDRTVTLWVPRRVWEQRITPVVWFEWRDQRGGPFTHKSESVVLVT
jgi:hypothetical protein